MSEIRVPVLNSTDETYVLLEWLVPLGGPVVAGEPVALLETSKAVSDLVTEVSGFLSPRIAPRTTCRPGEVAGLVSDSEAAARAGMPGPEPGPAEATGPVITRPARDLLERHHLAPAAVAGLGKPVVTRADVQAILDSRAGAVGKEPPAATQPLPARQRAVAATVSRSHATIPTAFIVMKMDADGLLRGQRRAGERERAYIGTVEPVIRAVARLRPRFPLFFAEVGDDLSVRTGNEANVGVTIDIGHGLFVPVVRGAAGLALSEISRRLMDFRVRARRGTFTEAELAGANIVLALHADPGVVLARPIIYPGQTCAVSLCTLQHELRLGAGGKVVEHAFVNVGVAYDHRIVNGADATAFLKALREELEAQAPEAEAPAIEAPEAEALPTGAPETPA